MKIEVRKKDFGQIFTPPTLVNSILENINYDNSLILGKLILEPSFGNGAFIIEIAKRILTYSQVDDMVKNLECIYGWELDNDLYLETLNRLETLIKPLNLNVNWNLECTNSIFKMSNFKGLISNRNTIKFDYIVGNPPYLIKRNIDKETKEYIATFYDYCYNNYDLYYAFFELALKYLKDDGKAGFITPSTYFYNYSAIKLRNHFINKKSISRIIDFRRELVFKDIWTFTCITIFDKKLNRDSLEYVYTEDLEPIIKDVKYSDLSKESWVFDEDDKEQSGKRLDEIAKIYQALNTQRDRLFVVKVESEEDKYSIVSSRFEKSFKIETSILKRITKISRQTCLDGIKKEYLIFPHEEDGDVFKLMSENKLMINYPLAYAYLTKYKDLLEKRPFKYWYAANDSFMKSINRLHGEKILFSYVMDAPNKFHYRNDNDIYYSGFIIKITDPNYSYVDVANILSSKESWEYFKNRFTTIKTGWSRVKVNIIRSFKL